LKSTPAAVSAGPADEPPAELLRIPEGNVAPTTLVEALARLTEAEKTLQAIGAGEVDAFMIKDRDGTRRVFTLSTADQLYRMFVENMHDGAATVSASGLILYANQRLAELLSCSREAIVGSHVSRFTVPGAWSVLEQAQLDSARDANVELDLVGADGIVVRVLAGVSPLEIDGDALSCVTFTDLRATKTLEEQLRQAQKMESIGSLAGGIAHDFNNLLTVIRGYSALLAPKVDDPKGQEAVTRIDQAAEQAAALTGQLLAFSRQQVLHPEVSDVNIVVSKTLTLLERLLGADILVESLLAPDLTPILVDRGQLTQVILNLAVNARDAMAKGGLLTIQTENCLLDDAYVATHQEVIPGRYVLIKVTDTGAGMDTETSQRVFDPFFTTKSTGTGLGLSTVYGIVRQSGGHIWIHSEPGIGTMFNVYFPATEDPILPPHAPIRVDSVAGNETILLVEDNETLRVLTAEVLESYGYRVLAAATGPEAIALADGESLDGIDLLLTDIVMPEMNGREVSERITESRPDLRVLFTSGYPSDAIVREGIAEARAAFIQKPYLAGDLALKIRELLTNSL
jgi:two-component system cell cycle sensor histidine kinase/response regulator CckA